MNFLKLLFCVFIALLSLMAIGEDISTGSGDPSTEESVHGTVSVSGKSEECKEAHLHAALCLKEQPLTEQQPEENNTNQLKKGSENLSFNFIYYILYKFKYIDIFELVRPSK